MLQTAAFILNVFIVIQFKHHSQLLLSVALNAFEPMSKTFPFIFKQTTCVLAF